MTSKRNRKRIIIEEAKKIMNYKAPFNCGWNDKGLGCKVQCIDCKLRQND
jgi:hypothetical protein